MTTTNIPQFEPVGPPCEVSGCRGVLWDHVDLKTKEFFHKCTECGGEFHRVSLKDKLGWAVRTIHRALEGTPVD